MKNTNSLKEVAKDVTFKYFGVKVFTFVFGNPCEAWNCDLSAECKAHPECDCLTIARQYSHINN